MIIEWNIQARAHTCQSCQRHFTDEESFHTLLFDQKTCYERLDICESCWAGQYSQGGTERKGFVSHWLSIYTNPPAASPDPIQKENAESLLRKLIERNEPGHLGACFVLAVMLERKRILKMKASLQESGGRVLIYEHAKTGDILQIRDPQLQLDQLEEVQRDVAELLEHGFTDPVRGAESGTAPESAVQIFPT
jgi:hypothetical protein